MVSLSKLEAEPLSRLPHIRFRLTREADIGAFLRRHLAGLDLGKLGNILQGAQILSAPTPLEGVKQWIDQAFGRFKTRCNERKCQIPEKLGTLEVAFVIDGKIEPHRANDQFLNRLFPSMPHLSGWAPWLDSRFASLPPDRPYVIDDGWEALLFEGKASLIGPHLDFWRMEPAGRFYHLRGLEDDLARATSSNAPEPYTTLDFLLATLRVAEMIAIGMSFALALGADAQTTSLPFGFRWRKLSGRVLACWVDPRRFFRAPAPAVQDEITTTVVVPLETPRTGIAPYVYDATEPLFSLFGGMQFDKSVIEGIVQELVQRRL